MTVIAAMGATALYLLYAWLASCIVASYLSARKGYGEKPGLAAGLLLSVVGVLLWLVWPARPDSRWKLQGPFGSGGKTVAEARAERAEGAEEGSGAVSSSLYTPLLLRRHSSTPAFRSRRGWWTGAAITSAASDCRTWPSAWRCSRRRTR